MNKFPVRILSFILTVALCFGLISYAVAEETTLSMKFFDRVLMLEGRIPRETKTASVFDTPDLSGRPAAKLATGDRITVLGVGKQSYYVSCGDITGYMSRKKLSLTGIPGESTPVSSEVISSSLAMANPYVQPKDEDYILLTGSAELNTPAESVVFFLWDEWQQAVERIAVWSPEAPAASLDAADWKKVLRTENLTAGRKTLCIQAGTGENTLVLARLPLFIAGKVKEPVNLNSQCTFSPNNERFLDESVETGWSPGEKRSEVTITLPEDGSAALVQAEWLKLPASTKVTVTDADGQVLLSETLETGFWVDTIPLPEGARTVVLRPEGKRVSLASLRVYGKDYPRDGVQQWEPMPEHLDILLFSAHQDDEVLFYSGLVPWYSHLGKKIGIVYMANCGRNRYREALRGMWYSGLRIHPVFLGFMDKEIASIDVAANCWPESQEAIVRQIRRCKPDIIVVQDLNGEYGHTQHRLMSKQVCLGAEYAADPSYDPESAAEYGTWDVKKLYVHLYEENQVHMNWEIPLDECGGLTPWDIAVGAFEMHYSQTKSRYFRMERQSRTYDSSLFGLYRTAVGPDTPGVNDLFENLN